MIGTILSHYTIEGLLGRGGMGEVYRATDMRLGRSVAIKLLPLSAAADDDRVRRFTQEAKAASSLNHPNIVTIHDIDQEGAVRFIVMEHVDGDPITSLTGKPMPVDQFLDVALQITAALAAAHDAGIVHRDIKPANVMLSRSGRVKVVDFGLARLTTPAGPTSNDDATEKWAAPQTTPGAVIGTVGYMSPEQVQGHRVDARSDVFSLGVFFYELLAGRRAFDGDSPIDTVAAILRDEMPPLTEVRHDIPQRLSAAIARCLAKRPENRFADAAELHSELEAVRQTLATRPAKHRGVLLAASVALLMVAGVAGFLWWRSESQRRWVQMAVPEIERMMKEDDLDSAFRLASRAIAIAPDDPQLAQTWANLTIPLNITSDPPGAEVAFRGYGATTAPWIPLGRTPIAHARMPGALVRFRITREGYTPIDAAPEAPGDTLLFRLHRPAETPQGMVFVAEGDAEFNRARAHVPSFWMDRHEVTNGEFKRFIAGGGYRRRELWKHPIVKNGQTIPWDEAMKEFVDVTGRPGPADWQLGTYAEGTDDHPVGGVSWYEAAAYAEHAGKTLPTVFHWARAAGEEGVSSDVVTMSNFASASPVPVGSAGGLGAYGTYDLAGNVKEWCVNGAGPLRYVLGGSWLDPTYKYREPDAQTALDRDRDFGFRLIRQNAPLTPDLIAEVDPSPREIPPVVDDATFRIYRRMFDYDAGPLNATVEEVDDSHNAWRREKVSFDAAYGGERMAAYLFIPRNARPPYQTVVVFPGSDAVFLRSSRRLWLRWMDFFIRSGRVLVYPVYKGTYERAVRSGGGPNQRRDLRVQRIQDVRRTVDYIATRPDLDAQRVAYYGLSLGASIAPLVLAVDDRFKTAIILAGGIGTSTTSLPEVQMQNYLPRVTLPLLFVTGRDDFTFPYERSQLPYFNLLGTPPENKRHVVVAGGHLPNDYAAAVREMLAWLDRWLGEVETR